MQEVIHKVDLSKLSKGEKILGVSSLALFILSFIPVWAKFETKLSEEFENIPGAEAAETSQSFSLWDAYGFLAKLGIILALAAFIIIVVRLTAPHIKFPVPPGQIYMGLGGIATLLMVLSLLTGPEGDQGSQDFGVGSVEYSRGLIGLILGIVAAAAMAYGAWLHMQEEGSGPAVTSGPPTTPPSTPPPPAS